MDKQVWRDHRPAEATVACDQALAKITAALAAAEGKETKT